jgi:hypothetical protein
MFMLTHTYFLQRILSPIAREEMEPDVYIYNVAPDLLAIHAGISAAKTHRIRRSLPIPYEYPKTAYVLYHLLVDDLSHHGYICLEYQDDFKIDSCGYAYKKGSPLVKSIRDLYGLAGLEMPLEEAVYQSHLIIEMIYDLVILRRLQFCRTIEILVEALDYTAKNKMNEFVATMRWLYGIDESDIREVMEAALLLITKDSLQRIMTIEGRIHLYQDKFGLKSDRAILYDGLKSLFQSAMDAIDDDEVFFGETTQIIKQTNVLPFLK